MKRDYTHGGNIFGYYEKYGRYPVDFSSSLNPLYNRLNLEEEYSACFNKCFIYPPYNYKLLREKIGEKEKVLKENICVSNGAGELIRFIPYIFNITKPMLVCPAFSEYEKSLKHADIKRYILKAENNFMIQEDFFSEIKGCQAVFITNPDNPVGNLIDYNFIEKTAEICMNNNALLVIDECFLDLSDTNCSAVPLIEKYKNIIIIKAFTKNYALAGLRLGYCISSEENIFKIDNMLPEWRVSYPAYLCGIKVLSRTDFLEQSRQYIKSEKEYLINNFIDFGFKIYGSKANYIFFYTEIYNLKEKLEEYGILIRDCENYYSLKKGYYRTAVKTHNENKLLIDSIKDIING